MEWDRVVVGGGASGIFSAIASASLGKKVLLLEKSNATLSKVRISGGGRCNVTHNLFDPLEVASHYPRGSKELISPLTRFGPKETVEWFASRGVPLKTESDGRMFPKTETSITVIRCLMNMAKTSGVVIRKLAKIEKIQPGFEIFLRGGEILKTQELLLATGSSPQGHKWAKILGHSIQPPIPSLFTFNVPTSSLKDLSGISISQASLSTCGHHYSGPLLITHFGFSGPAAIKLSSWAAKELHALNYRANLTIDWLPECSHEEVVIALKKKTPLLPKKLWKHFTKHLKPNPVLKNLHEISKQLKSSLYQVEGKTQNKEEFVTCGGITLSEVNFKTMESKCCPKLFFSGEILDIDGVTGGFNFQNAWSTGWVAAQRSNS